MISLLPGIASVALRRLTHTQDVTWPRWRLYVLIVCTPLTSIALLTFVLATNPPSDPLQTMLMPVMISLLLVVTAGTSVLVAESTRDRSGSSARGLSTLPLKRWQIAFLSGAPSALLALAVLAAPLAPAFAALRSVGMSLNDAVFTVSASTGAGLLTIGIPFVIAAQAMRGARWDAVRFPVALITWGGLLAWQIGTAVAAAMQTGHLFPLPVSAVLTETLRDGVSPSTAAWNNVGGLIALLCISVTFVATSSQDSPRFVRREWRGRSLLARVRGELVYALRDANVRANAIISVVVSTLVVVATLTLPREAHQTIFPLVATIVAALALVAPRMLRGVFPRVDPPQRVLGLSATSWTLSQSSVVTFLVGAFSLPAVFLFVAHPEAVSGWLLLAKISLAAAVAVLAGVLFPVGPNNALGQGLASGGALCGYLITAVLLENSLPKSAGSQALLGALALGAAVAAAVAIESTRWAPRVTSA